MFTSFSNSWQLLKASFNVLRSDKQLIVFPIVSMIGSIIVILTFAFPLLATGILSQLGSGRSSNSAQVVAFIVAFLFYVVMYTVIIFCNTALVGAVMMRLKGEEPTLRAGFNIAFEHLGSIVGYAVISATVGMILRAIAQRGGIIGRIVASLIGFAWNIATFLVVPVLVVENVDPIEAIKRSAKMLRQTWGEQLVGNFSLSIASGLIFFALVLVVFVPLMLIATSLNSAVLIGIAIFLFVAAAIAMSLLTSALQGIYVAAVYNYAVTGSTGGLFSEDLVRGAFRTK